MVDEALEFICEKTGIKSFQKVAQSHKTENIAPSLLFLIGTDLSKLFLICGHL